MSGFGGVTCASLGCALADAASSTDAIRALVMVPARDVNVEGPYRSNRARCNHYVSRTVHQAAKRLAARGAFRYDPCVIRSSIPALSALSALLASALLASALFACGSDPKPPPKTADDGVPANSASEARLAMAGGKNPDAPPTPPPSSDAPQAQAQPVMTPVTPGASGSSATTDSPPKPASNANERVSKADCEAAASHGLDLMIQGDPRFAGIPPEVLQTLKGQAFAQAAQQGADKNPCAGKGITRAEYDCEMGAPTFDDFKKCEAVAKPQAKPDAKPKKKK